MNLMSQLKIEVRRGNIFYADLNGNKGSEQGGIRPVLVIQNEIGNKFSPTTIVAPLTSKNKKKTLPTQVFLDAMDNGLKCDSFVMLEQITRIDKSRLLGFVADINKNKMEEVNSAIGVSLGLA